MIINAFSGAGKTYLKGRYKSVIDLEPMDYHWAYPECSMKFSQEQRKKMSNRTENPDWPENYIYDILKYHQQGSIVLIGGSDEIIDYLEEHSTSCLVLVPSPDQKEDYLKRFERRGNKKAYIDFWDEHFEEYIIKKMKYKNIVWMLPGEYLEDTLKRINVI